LITRQNLEFEKPRVYAQKPRLKCRSRIPSVVSFFSSSYPLYFIPFAPAQLLSSLSPVLSFFLLSFDPFVLLFHFMPSPIPPSLLTPFNPHSILSSPPSLLIPFSPRPSSLHISFSPHILLSSAPSLLNSFSFDPHLKSPSFILFFFPPPPPAFFPQPIRHYNTNSPQPLSPHTFLSSVPFPSHSALLTPYPLTPFSPSLLTLSSFPSLLTPFTPHVLLP
jgi:hypothetical protein